MYYAFDIKVRNTKEFDLNSELFIPFSLKSAAKLFDEDKEASYISELNSDFINESGIKKHFEKNTLQVLLFFGNSLLISYYCVLAIPHIPRKIVEGCSAQMLQKNTDSSLLLGVLLFYNQLQCGW